MDFLEKLAKRNGKLRKGGEPDLNSVAVSVINDWQRGKLPYFVAPPRTNDEEEDEDGEGAIEEGEFEQAESDLSEDEDQLPRKEQTSRKRKAKDEFVGDGDDDDDGDDGLEAAVVDPSGTWDDI